MFSLRIDESEDNEFLYNQFDNIEGLDIEGMPCDIEEHEIELNEGWNLISSYLVPYFGDIEVVFGKLVRDESLEMVKNEQGRFFNPENRFSNLERWNSQRAYYVKVNEPLTLTIKGEEHM